MSAILGILRFHGQRVEQSVLQKMAQVMSHRGPDDQGFWSQGSTGLGHGMFRTTPESLHEKQPFEDSESGFVITADARIDNREELAKSLGLGHAVREGFPDSYFILSAYKKWGEQCVNHLLGDFSFAIWNPRDNCLFCARDHMGVKPFNYYADQNGFVFASEVQAIQSVRHVNLKINEGRIADYLLGLEGIDKTSTFFENTYRLPPAHTLLVKNGKISTRSYWEPDSEKRIVLASDEDYLSAFTEIYTDAIEKRMRGNGDVASMLSGGMDSSSIVGFARDLHHAKTGKPFPVFSANSTSPDCRETHFINAVISQGGLSASSISIDEFEEMNNEITKVVYASQEPFDPMIMIIAIYLLAKKSNYRVMLDGIDGDVIASVSPSYPSVLLKDGDYRKALNAMSLQSENYYAGRLSTAAILYQNLRSAYTPQFLRKCRSAWRKYTPQKLPKNGLINKEFATRVDLAGRRERYSSHGGHNRHKSIHEIHAGGISHPHIPVALERYDRTAALCGIEPRHPLLDKRVIDFMVSIPLEQKVRHGWSKYLLRKTAEPVLSQDVCWRRGWEHVGWNFERKWLETNLVSVTNSINNSTVNLGQYLCGAKVRDIMGEISGKSASDDIVTNMFEVFLLNNWIKRKVINEKTT